MPKHMTTLEALTIALDRISENPPQPMPRAEELVVLFKADWDFLYRIAKHIKAHGPISTFF